MSGAATTKQPARPEIRQSAAASGSDVAPILDNPYAAQTFSKLPYEKPSGGGGDAGGEQERRAEPDFRDEMALRFDLSKSNPDLDTLQRRAVWRPHLDARCLPFGQRFMLLTTYGPDPAFDVQAPQVGFINWGGFASEQEAADHIAEVRERNPHAAFYTMHICEMTGAIDLPPPSDGGTRCHHLNRNVDALMSRHFARSVDQAKDVQRRMEDSLRAQRAKTDVLQALAGPEATAAMRAAASATANAATFAATALPPDALAALATLEAPSPNRRTAAVASVPAPKDRGSSAAAVSKRVVGLPVLRADQVDLYVRDLELATGRLGDDHRVEYTRRRTADGRMAMFRTIYKLVPPTDTVGDAAARRV
ncbi:Hypothetical protein UVM_LOCUS404 [uncultured virus]|nr:Hypothetical protein UVM_LOCUS404 [uncultured virus]